MRPGRRTRGTRVPLDMQMPGPPITHSAYWIMFQGTSLVCCHTRTRTAISSSRRPRSAKRQTIVIPAQAICVTKMC